MKLHKNVILASLGAFLSVSAFSYAQDAPAPEAAALTEAPEAAAPADAPQRGPKPEFRRGGQRGPGMFMAYRGIATEEQTKEMMEIMKSYGPQFKALVEKKMAIEKEMEKEMEAVDEEMMKLRKEMTEKCDAVLTDEQREEVKARMEEMRKRGPRGPQGDRGPHGERGPRGERGPHGPHAKGPRG